ncbi:MAG: pilus assembly protein PilM [Phycisphaerales bacterium]|nr:pilus assembly protein PilM [Phycisphaerales bacterium]
MNTLNGNTLPIAIDFGVSSLKILQLTAGDPPSLVAAACLPTPEDFLGDPAKRFEFQFKALPKLVRSVGFKGKRAMCAIPAAQMFCKHMQFPRGGVGVAELVRQAVPEALGCAAEALIYRHVVVENPNGAAGPAAGKQEVICMAASRQFIGQMMDSIRDARLEPVGMHPECLTAVRAFEQIHRRENDASVATLYLDIAAGTTKAWVAHGHNLVFAKTIGVGGRDLDLAVARSLECDLTTARSRRLNAAVLVAEAVRAQGVPGARAGAAPIPPAAGCGMAMLAAALAKDATDAAPKPDAPADAAALAEDRRAPRGGLTAPGLTMDLAGQNAAPVAPPEFDVREPLEMLTDEIAGCLRYHQSLFGGRRIDRVIFMGGEARHRGLCQHIARRVKSPAHVADPLARMARTGKEPCHGVDFGAMQPGWTTVFGLGLCPTDF